jgi:hypothetical protein
MVLAMHTRILQERGFSNPTTDDELKKKEPPMLRIEKESDGHTTNLQLSGRIQSADIGELQAQMGDEHVRIFMDLGEVTLVDIEVVRFLSECEDGALYWFTVHRMFASEFFASEPKGHSHTFRMASDWMVYVQRLNQVTSFHPLWNQRCSRCPN